MHVEKAFVICLFFFSAAHGVRIGNRCIGNLTKVFTVQLECPAGEWIHVVQEVYGDGDAATCHVKSADSCSKELVSSQFGLIVNCNGKPSCREAMFTQPVNSCNITDAAADVKYNCINGSMNMCSPVTTTVNGTVYLHSPGFPDSVGVTSSCVARITGQNIEVALMEQRMRSGMLDISGDGRQLWTNVNVNQYNRVLPGQAAEIVIVYDNHDQDGSNLWIRVAGQMNITISGETSEAPTTTTSTPQPSRSQSTSSPSTSDTETTKTTIRVHSTTTEETLKSKATQQPSESTTIVSTTASITNTDKSTVSDTMTGDPTTSTTTAVTTPKSTTAVTTPKSTTAVTTPKSTTAVTTPMSTTAVTTPMSTTAVTTPMSTTAVTTPKSATVMTTKEGEAYSTTTSSPEPGLIVWVVSAVSGCVVTVFIVVIAVVLCRKHVKKSRPLETPGKGHFERPSELSSINTEKHHNGFGQNGAGGGQSLNTEPGHRTETSLKNEQDQYAKAVPLDSTVDMHDKSTFTVTNNEADNGDPNVIMVDNAAYDNFDFDKEKESVQDDSDTSPNHSKQVWKNNCEMTENGVYDGGPPNAANENNVDDSYGVGLETNVGMVDNGLYDKFDFDREKESVQDESDTSPNNSKQSWRDDCEMIENDVCDEGGPHLYDPVGSMAENDNPVGGLYAGGLETSEGMVDNELYDKCEYDREKDSLQDESETSPSKSNQAWKNDCDMVENDAYERGPPR